MSCSSLALLAFVSGTVVPIEAVPDPVFAEKMLGDGIAIEAESGRLTAPCAGTVTQVHRAGHAYGILAPGGARVLLHVGLDTVKLKGLGFSPKVAAGDQVQAGQVLLEFDLAELARQKTSALTILVVENSDEHPVSWRATGPVRSGQDPVLGLGAGLAEGVVASPEAVAAPPEAVAGSADFASGTASARHEQGLHARPAAMVANAARAFRSAIEVVHLGRRANARSAVALMGLAVEENAQVEVVATGADAGAALAAVVAAIEAGFTAATAAVRQAQRASAPAPEQPRLAQADGELVGVSASRGLSVGRTFHYRLSPAASDIPEQGQGPALERETLDQALAAATSAIEAALQRAERKGSRAEAAIFGAHRALIDDPELLDRAHALIATGKSAAFAWMRALGEQRAVLEASGSALIAERSADLQDLERQVLQRLSGETAAAPRLPENTILLAEALTPGELAALDHSRLAGIVTQQGGPTSHVAILARSHGIPALTAVGPALRLVPEGQLAVLDATGGTLFWKPTEPQVSQAKAGIEANRHRRAEAQRFALAPALTLDGTVIEVAANIAHADEAAGLLALGADGVGLLRTELFFMDRQTAPSEEEQRVAYQRVLDDLGERSVVIRTLDVGADKSLAYLPMPPEENPALGLRGIRLGLARPELLRDQLRACLRLRPVSRVRILLPMVTDLDDVIRTRQMLEALAAELGLVELPQLGVMIETPAAALLSDQLAEVADFFSLGSNDLTQYTLAADRTNSAVALRLDDFHPAVLRLIHTAARGAADHGRWVGLCGGMASDPLAAPLLIGLGVTELSASPGMVAELKQTVRLLSLGACQEAARHALRLTSGLAVRNHLRSVWPWLDPQV